MKTKVTEKDYIKSNRKSSRESEFESHGKAVNFKHVQKTQKAYSRKRVNTYNGEEEEEEYGYNIR